MPQYLSAEPAESILRILADALDLVDIGVLLLDHDLRVRFINRRQIEIFAIPSALLAAEPTFRDLLDHAGTNARFPIEGNDLSDYLDRREAAVRTGFIPPTRIYMKDGRRLLYSCMICPEGGRILTYTDISRELAIEATEAMEAATAEMRFRTETLEGQAAYLVSLVETADQNAREIEHARQQLEFRIDRQMELEGELRRLATTDGLTGTLNRTGFLNSAQHKLERTPGRLVTVLMLDIDHFKKVNDQHGHAAGDAALKHFVLALNAGIRDIDLFGRLGGEEFAILIPAMAEDTVALIAERLRARVAEKPVSFDNKLIHLTVSVGLAGSLPADQSIEQIIARADAALYVAKASGRNCVVRYQSQEAGCATSV